MKILLCLGMFYLIASLFQCGPHNFVQHEQNGAFIDTCLSLISENL